MDTLKKLNKNELINEYKAQYQLINEIGSYGVKDLIYLDALEAELDRRKITFSLTPTFKE